MINQIFLTTLAIFLLFPNASIAQETTRFWVGANNAGIYTGELNTAEGSISNVKPVAEGLNTHYIAKHPTKPVLYAVSRTSGPSKISSFDISEDGNLAPQSSLDDRPFGVLHVNPSPNGHFLAVAYSRSSMVGVYRLKEDGSIDSLLIEVLHEGTGVLPAQDQAQPHWVGFSEDSQYLYVTDKGTDHIWVYAVDEQNSQLRLLQKAAAPAGSGPRNIAFHPTLSLLYVSDELADRVSRYQIDPHTAELTYLDSMPSAAEINGEESEASDIRIHPSGKFLYMIDRGFDRISVFAINDKTGDLTAVEREPVRGSISRNIVFDKDGNWALVVGYDSNTLAVFHINQTTGELTYERQMASIPTPLAIVID